MSYCFAEKLFDMKQLAEQMSPVQLIDFVSAVVSIVMSHQYQKEEIKKLVTGTAVDFKLVRETMYKYSKKAENRFLQNPHLAFCLYKFATIESSKAYILNKFSKVNPT